MSGLVTAEVKDRDADGALAPSLFHLLALISGVLGPVGWRVYELEATGHGATDLRDLGERIERGPAGLPMSTDQLSRVAADLHQVINAILVVPGSSEPPAPPPIDAAFYAACRLVLECVDGDVWRVTTTDERVHSRLRSEFRDVVTMSS